MLRYFGYLLFPCLIYQPILGQWFLSLTQGHIEETRGFLSFSRGVEKEHLPGNIVGLLFCFHFVFCFVFSLSILKGPTLPWDKIISRLFHLNEICDFIVSEQVSFLSRYQYVYGKCHRTRKKLDYQFTMIIIWISYAMIIICYFSRSRMHSFSIYLAWQMMASP